MRSLILLLCLFTVLSWAQQQGDTRPSISTEKGDLRISSPGNMVFMAGDGGSVEFMSSNGSGLVVGEKGEKGDRGDRGDQGLAGATGPPGATGPQGAAGPQGLKGFPGTDGDDGVNGAKGVMGFKGSKGQQGVRGVSATDSSLVTWNECVWQNLNDGRNYGQIAMCTLNKARNDTWIRVSWNGNMRITRCSICCMRWYFTINGEECADPGAIDTVIFQSQNLQILRQTHLTGVCRSTTSIGGERVLGAGPVRVQFLIQECIQFGGFVYDAYTGWNSVSRITVEEIIPREVSTPEVRVYPPTEYTYTPNYCQYFFAHLDINRERNIGVITQVIFNKLHDHTVLRITWEGNIRKSGCFNCCSKWWIEIDGSPCSKFEDISTSITSNVAQDIFAPTTISGFCAESGLLQIGVGDRHIQLRVGECPGFGFTNTGSGFYSTSRMIVEELPLSRDPLVNAQVYHPQWAHCAIPSISNGGIDNGTLKDTSCFLNKTSNSSAIRVTFNGVIRVFNCEDCCMRWYVTLNGQECSSPAPIEAIVYSTDSRGLSLHRGSTITGLCSNIEAGSVEAVLNVGPCAGSNETFDANTGFNAPSTMTVEEIPLPEQASLVQGYHPRWLQCTTPEPLNTFTNMSEIMLASNSSDPASAAASIQACSYNKQGNDTALKISWHGNIAVVDCETCCVRWFLTIDGKECSNPGPVDAALVQDVTGRDEDLTRPASIVGICSGINSLSPLNIGTHLVELRVGACMDTRENGNPDNIPAPSHALTGLNSVSRIVIEELPPSTQTCRSEIVQPRR